VLIYNVRNRAHRVLKLTIKLKRFVNLNVTLFKFQNRNSFIIITDRLKYNMSYAFKIKRLFNLKNPGNK